MCHEGAVVIVITIVFAALRPCDARIATVRDGHGGQTNMPSRSRAHPRHVIIRPGDFQWTAFCPSYRGYLPRGSCPDYMQTIPHSAAPMKRKKKVPSSSAADFQFVRWCPHQRGYFANCLSPQQLAEINSWPGRRNPHNRFATFSGGNFFQRALQQSHGGHSSNRGR
ncbi:hypothetical protein BV898_07599 [Hypsibius exemplaris]|uniref:Secreted protein n=1 Tax=Hypsibius exemplaris TaxID=2072580 RepID=A0A1W0WT75_HYPEX|nr:hypothetical protein BV898_07599 [Hypsibius exemplaris]